jgi:hypothetical protein
MLLHAMTSDDAATRAEGADRVTDVLRDLDPLEAVVLAHALVTLRLAETDGRCQEAQLHALAELAAWHPLPDEALGRLRYLDSATVTGSEHEYLDDLLTSG